MMKRLETIIAQEDESESTFDELKESGVVFHLFANSGEGVYVPGENAAERADAVLKDVFADLA